VIRFLFDTRRGHCELFAAGLVAMCRSIGIPARMVVGFRASEYSDMGGYYVVRQSHAHAWTEIDAGPGIGWITLDATPAAPVAAHHAADDGLLSTTARTWEYLEFNWIRQVVGFGPRTRAAALNLIHDAGHYIKKQSSDLIASLGARLSMATRGFNPAAFAAAVVSAIIGTLLFALRTRLRRRGRSSRPEACPDAGGEPAFYHQMQAVLEGGGLRRREGQTPRAFAHTAGKNRPALRETLPALTETYYAVRFGGRTLDEAAQREVDDQIADLVRALTSADTASAPPD